MRKHLSQKTRQRVNVGTFLLPSLDLVRLFHPRLDNWEEHFDLSESLIIPKTDIIKATFGTGQKMKPMNDEHPQSPEGTSYATIGQSPIIRFISGIKALKGRYIGYGVFRYVVLSGLLWESFTFMGLRPMLYIASLRDF